MRPEYENMEVYDMTQYKQGEEEKETVPKEGQEVDQEGLIAEEVHEHIEPLQPAYLDDSRPPECPIDEEGLPSDLDLSEAKKTLTNKQFKDLTAVLRKRIGAFA